MKRLIAGCSLLFLMLHCSAPKNDDIENITCQQASDLIQEFRNNTSFIILDLRTEDMFMEEHIENSIYHDVFSEDFEDWLKGLDKEKVYLLYCNVGHRSGIALKKMKEMGFKNLYHLHEGIRVWKEQDFPTVRNDE
ncbi:MAG: hypothetical protein AMS27_07665 [Bacteroides sp. SM23_62_1]|nr:MAG: hypothetical protein AMS27_07665 [Bacteroides sp. SM23_62_1]